MGVKKQGKDIFEDADQAAIRLLNQTELPEKFTVALKNYKGARDGHPKASHDLIRQFFVGFLHEAYGVQYSEINIEEAVLIEVRGFIDALFQHVIFEFKKDFKAEKSDGLVQLKNYLSSRKNPESYFGILTDGIVFEAYRLRGKSLEILGVLDIVKCSQSDAFLWFDKFIFSTHKIRPTADDMVQRFGPRSPVYIAVKEKLSVCFRVVDGKGEVQTKFNEWKRLLAKVYGSDVGRDDLFVTHTYLSLVSKILAYSAVMGRAPAGERELNGLATGKIFRDESIENLAEPDFFMWVLEDEIWDSTKTILVGLAKYLSIFEVSDLGVDILQQLYEGLIDPVDRHDLGEYYTPSWLAELSLREAKFNKTDSMLDPSCGSGTFLFYAIKLLREEGLSGHNLVQHAIQNVAGVDVHPVAVSIARTNFIMALASDVRAYRGSIRVPIYMADTLHEIREEMDGNYLAVSAYDNLVFEIPISSSGEDFNRLDKIIDALGEFAQLPIDEGLAGLEAWLKRGKCKAPDRWLNNLRALKALIVKRKDTVWPFILHNASKPALMSQKKFSLVIGNPPWLSYRYIKDPLYSKRIRELTFSYGLLDKKARHLFTHMELATAFFAYCLDKFVEHAGRIAFVMPRSILTGSHQHKKFQSFEFGSVQATPIKILDCEDVWPLFNVPSCVMIASKKHSEWSRIPRLVLNGRLDSKNISLEEALGKLKRLDGTWSVAEDLLGPSPYVNCVLQGATIVPRSIWFVAPSSVRGPVDRERPMLETAEEVSRAAKKPWTNIKMHGRVEHEFLFGTMLSEDVLPFGMRNVRLLVCPAVQLENMPGCRLIEKDEAIRLGYPALGDWLTEAERLWKERSKNRSMSLYGRLDYNRTLTRQTLKNGIYVIYNGTGTNIASCVVDVAALGARSISNLRVNGIIIDCKFYHVKCATIEEAHYLSAFLNTPSVNEFIKPFQTRGQLGERDIHRRPFEHIPIPIFDARNEQQRALVHLGKECHAIVSGLIKDGKVSGTVGRARGEVREILTRKLSEIDVLARGLIGKATRRLPRGFSVGS